MTLSNHRVTVVYTGEGASAALTLNGEILKRPGLAESLELLDACQIREVVERDAVVPGNRSAVRPRVELLDRDAVVGLVAASDVVIAW
jgi:hypothetical protein